MKLDFTGQSVLVTGGGSGIGRAACLAFAESGARIACVDRDQALGAEVVEQIRGRAGRRSTSLPT